LVCAVSCARVNCKKNGKLALMARTGAPTRERTAACGVREVYEGASTWTACPCGSMAVQAVQAGRETRQRSPWGSRWSGCQRCGKTSPWLVDASRLDGAVDELMVQHALLLVLRLEVVGVVQRLKLAITPRFLGVPSRCGA
jgi:hypothetical protein